MNKELHELIVALAYARRAEASANSAHRAAYERWAEEHADLIKAQTEAKQLTARLDAALREKAVALYMESGDKRLHGAVTVREIKKLVYDADRARDWAIEHGQHSALTIAKPALEALIKMDAIPADIAGYLTEPSVAVSTVLDEYIAGE